MTDNCNHAHRDVGGIGLVTVLLALVFLFVWPGPLRWEYKSGNPTIKIDRISGKTFVLTGEGWRKMATDVRQAIPLGQYSDILTRDPSLPIRGWPDEDAFSLEVYNGSGWALTELLVEVKIGKVARLCYMKPEATIEPGASGTVSTTVPDDLVIPSEDQRRESHWKVTGAKGYPVD